MPKFDKFHQFNCIADIYEPRYSTNDVLIAVGKLKRSKKDIKLVFSKVNPTSEYAGEWYITHKKAMSYRSKMDNNGLDCKVIPWDAFSPIEYNINSMMEL
jgi:hypothetical protein